MAHPVYDPLPSTTNDPRFAPSPSPEPASLSYTSPSRDLPPLPSHPDEYEMSPTTPITASMPPFRGDVRTASSPLLSQEEFSAAPAQPGPRFIGPALYDEGQTRYSLVSTHTAAPSVGGHSDLSSSVYALNDVPGSSYFDEREYRDDPNERPFYSSRLADPTRPPLPRNRYLDEKHNIYASPRTVSKRKLICWSILAGSIVIIAAVVIPLYFVVIKPKNRPNSPSTQHSTSAHQPTTTARPPQTNAAITGGDGSTVTQDDGATFVYQNSFGGYWYYDPNNPHHNAARAQSWSPALNETFHYGVDRIRGVNLGGWLVTEPFIVPALYESYPGTVDEWHLSLAMAADTANGGLDQLENHYKTFITERDFAQIAGAGLNFVRIPIAYWAIETRAGEPFLPRTSWNYFLKAIQWARKYGIRINLDLHALPGSQNGWNHSGRLGTVNVLNGPMGVANAQRSLDYIRILAEFISQPQYSDVITMFGITNEPQGSVVGQSQLSSFYLQAYNAVREASGTGEGKGPYVSLHDGFFNRAQWAGFLAGADRLALDSHPYMCFGPQSNAAMSTYTTRPCGSWGAAVNASMAAFGMNTAGEFSNAVTDCGKWVNGVDQGSRYEGNYALDASFARVGSCTTWTDWQNYDQDTKDAIKAFALASMDALQNWFFWTWKIGNSSETGTVESPAWSYQLGFEHGWMPTDPREADGICGNSSPWTPPLSAWQTGGVGAGTLAADQAALVWPPRTISNAGAASRLPIYTPTGVVPTLPEPTFSPRPTSNQFTAGRGWNNPGDTAGLMVPISTCSYLDPWVGDADPPPVCGQPRKRRLENDYDSDDAAGPIITPPPRH